MNILITGGAGFIGCHTADYFAQNHKVKVIDNLVRKGSEFNLKWLNKNHKIEFAKVDICDSEAILNEVKNFKPDAVIHLAAQVAVTTSVTHPMDDFNINALGTLNLLEAIRLHASNASFVFASTNKVYGNMEDIAFERQGKRYAYIDCHKGADEKRPLDFHSPYGCSKGSADQYVRDYARIYGLKTVVFRMSCIYGTRQFGIEDQGWVAWFTIRAAINKPVTIFGDGAQVRDILWVKDLVRAYKTAIDAIEQVKGEVFNLGGGYENQLSLIELLDLLNEIRGSPVKLIFSDWRPGDQRVFIANTTKAKKLLNWEPSCGPKEGVKKIFDWVKDNIDLFS